MTIAAPATAPTPTAPLSPQAPQSPQAPLTIQAPAPIDSVPSPGALSMPIQQMTGLAPINLPGVTPAGVAMAPAYVKTSPGSSLGAQVMSGLGSGVVGMGLNQYVLNDTPLAGYGGALSSLLQGNTKGAINSGASMLGSQLLNQAGYNVAPGTIGTVLNFAQNGVNSQTVGSAAGSYIGTTIGTAIGGPIGGFIGGTIGGTVGGGCFITQAVMAAVGGHDSSHELQVLRAFRDGYMLKSPQTAALVKEYYQVAPLVVDALNRRPDAQQIYVEIYHRFVAPAVQAITQGNMPLALEIYAAMLKFVVPFAQQAEPHPVARAGMQQLGNDSAQVHGALSQLRGVQ